MRLYSLDAKYGVRGADFVADLLQSSRRIAMDALDRLIPHDEVVSHVNGRLYCHPELQCTYFNGVQMEGGSLQTRRVAIVSVIPHPHGRFAPGVMVALCENPESGEEARYRDLIAVGWYWPPLPDWLVVRSGGRFVLHNAETEHEVVRLKRGERIIRKDSHPLALYALLVGVEQNSLLDSCGHELHDLPCHKTPPFPLYAADTLDEATNLFQRVSVATMSAKA